MLVALGEEEEVGNRAAGAERLADINQSNQVKGYDMFIGLVSVLRIKGRNKTVLTKAFTKCAPVIMLPSEMAQPPLIFQALLETAAAQSKAHSARGSP